MSKAPSFWSLVASALLTMESIVTFRPSALNSPSSSATYRPASSATGTEPTVSEVFSRPDGFGEALGPPHPALSMTISATLAALITCRNLRLMFL